MAKVILGITMSVDGFINDRHGSVDRLYPDLPTLDKTELMQESIRTTGAVVMGRHAYDMAHGDITGYEYQVPLFIVTHKAPQNVAKGENENLTLTFVTSGVASAIEKAKAAAGDKNVVVIGSADIPQQCLNAGLVDEIHLGIIPVLLGEGLRLFEHLTVYGIDLEKYKLVETPGRIDIFYRVLK